MNFIYIGLIQSNRNLGLRSNHHHLKMCPDLRKKVYCMMELELYFFYLDDSCFALLLDRSIDLMIFYFHLFIRNLKPIQNNFALNLHLVQTNLLLLSFLVIFQKKVLLVNIPNIIQQSSQSISIDQYLNLYSKNIPVN